MAKREVRVVINGEEYVSKAAASAETGLSKFLSGAKKAITSLGAVLAGAALGKFFASAVDAANEYESSLRKLDGVARITGTPLGLLNDLADTGRQKFRLSATTANDLAVEMAKLASKAGDVGKAGPALEAFLNIGAARGLSATETLTAVQQAILGIDEGTDKLFNANPSVLYEQFARAIGTTAGKLTDQQKAQALLNAALVDGAKVQDAYQSYLRSWAGIQEGVKNGMQQLLVEVGRTITGTEAFGESGASLPQMLGKLALWIEANRGELGKFVDAGVMIARNLLDALVGTFTAMKPILTGVLIVITGAVAELSFGLRGLGASAQFGAGLVAKFLGYMLEQVTGLLRKLGLNVGSELTTTLNDWGTRMESESASRFDALANDHRAFWLRMLRDTQTGVTDTGAETRKLGSGYSDAATQANTLGNASQTAGEKASRSFRDAAGSAVALAEAMTKRMKPAIEELNARFNHYNLTHLEVQKAEQKSFDTTRLRMWNDTMASITRYTDEVVANTIRLGGELPKVSDHAKWWASFQKDVAANLKGAAVGAIDLAASMGGISRETQTTLSNVVSIAEQFPKMLGGSATGMLGVIGAAASILGQLFRGNPEHMRIVRENSASIAKLTREVGNLNLGVSGDTLERTQSGVTAFLDAMRKNPRLAFDSDGAGRALSEALAQQGLLFGDLEDVAKRLGITLDRSNPRALMGTLSQLLEALNVVQPGRIGQSFADQFEFFQQTQRLNGASTADNAQALAQFLARFSPAFAGVGDALAGGNVDGARQLLVELFTRLNNGEGLAAGELGRLTGTEFRDALLQLVGVLDDLKDDTTTPTTGPAPTSPETPAPSSPLPGEDAPITAPVPDAPTFGATLGDIAAAITAATATVATYHTDALGFAARTADATEATARNTAAAVDVLLEIADALGATENDTDTALGASLALQRRVSGSASL